MSEKNIGHMDFQSMDSSTSKDIGSLHINFEFADSIKSEKIKEYAKNIAQKIAVAQSDDEKKSFLVDMLSDFTVLKMVWHGLNYQDERSDEFKEFQKSAMSSVHAIKKSIIYELEKTLSPDLFYFVTENLGQRSSNDLKYLDDSKLNNVFYKDLVFLSSPEFSSLLRESLEKLKLAISKHRQTGEMPFVIQPLQVNNPKLKKSVAYTAEKRNLITVSDIFDGQDSRFSTYDGLLAIVDCLRGAKFLSENGFTLTDISNQIPGTNLGFDVTNKKGVLFDLDGLLQIDKKAKGFVAPMLWGKPVFEIIPPEVVKYGSSTDLPLTGKSMIWEIGCVLARLSKKMIGNKSTNIDGWEELKDAGIHMMTKDLAKRPDFDDCINVLEAIINRNFGNNSK